MAETDQDCQYNTAVRVNIHVLLIFWKHYNEKSHQEV